MTPASAPRLARLALACARRPLPVVLLGALLVALSAWYAAGHFRLNTDTARLISPDVSWRRDELAFDRAFPQRADLILAVVDAATPEAAEAAAASLTERLGGQPALIRSARRPDADPYFARNGLLLLPLPEVEATLGKLLRQQPLLGPLSADPSLRGLLGALGLGLRGVEAGEAKLADLAAPASALADTAEAALAGRERPLSFRALLGDAPRERRRFVLIQPVIDFGALEPAGEAIALVRRVAAEAGLNAPGAPTVRLTGPAPMAAEEFGTIKEDAGLNAVLTVGSIIVILYAALRSARAIVAVVLTLSVGLVVTAALGLLLVGEFNPISVAFAALFVGLGVDFAIQVAVRARQERHALGLAGGGDAPGAVPASIGAAAGAMGGGVMLAAVSLAAGFVSFLPTAYRGLSDLGLIAGAGMIVAGLLSLTLLPALLALLRPPAEAAEPGTPALRAADRWIEDHRRAVLLAAGAAVLLGAPALAWLRFDADPINLRSPKVESVATYLDLARDPATSPQRVDVLAASEAEAAATAARLRALPEVAEAINLADLVPADQEPKLAAIGDAALLLGPVLEPGDVAPAPDDAALAAALREAAPALSAAADRAGGAPGAAEARRLAGALERLAAGAPEARALAQRAALGGFPALVEQLRALLSAEPVARADLPPGVVAEWVAADGRARVEAAPRGDANDPAVLARFVAAVRAVAPNAVGAPVVIVEAGGTVVRAFLTAGALALAAVTLILLVALRRAWDVFLTLGPLIVAGYLTLVAAALLDWPLNFANIIALPLMLGVGVAFHIYYVVAWRAGERDALASPLTRAVFFSALTTGVAFGSLWLSAHPGTASMGRLLTLSLIFTLLAAFVLVPAVLGPPEEGKS